MSVQSKIKNKKSGPMTYPFHPSFFSSHNGRHPIVSPNLSKCSFVELTEETGQ